MTLLYGLHLTVAHWTDWKLAVTDAPTIFWLPAYSQRYKYVVGHVVYPPLWSCWMNAGYQFVISGRQVLILL
jgi:hypothetical protein